MLRVTREERDLLREEALCDLSCAGDLSGCDVRRGPDGDFLSRRRRVADGLWLLDDLGWTPEDAREAFYLTMPAERLAAWLQRTTLELTGVLKDATGGLYSARHPDEPVEYYEASKRENREAIDTYLDTQSLCRRLLEAVA